MSDFLDAKLKEIRDRVTELRPVVDEFHRLEAADQALTASSSRLRHHRAVHRRAAAAFPSRQPAARAARKAAERARSKRLKRFKRSRASRSLS